MNQGPYRTNSLEILNKRSVFERPPLGDSQLDRLWWYHGYLWASPSFYLYIPKVDWPYENVRFLTFKDKVNSWIAKVLK